MDSDKAIQGANISQLSVNLQILHRIMCTKGILGRVSIDILDRHSINIYIDTLLGRHSIDT